MKIEINSIINQVNQDSVRFTFKKKCMILNTKKFSIALFVLFLSAFSYAQKQTYVVVSTSYEKPGNNVLSTYGVSIERQFSTHWGFEIGLNEKDFIYPSENIKMKFAAVPLSLKYYSKIINIKVGTEANFYGGFKYISDLVVPNQLYIDLFKLTYTSKISKDINLTSNFILEPEVLLSLFNPVNYNDLSIGVGLRLKYKL